MKRKKKPDAQPPPQPQRRRRKMGDRRERDQVLTRMAGDVRRAYIEERSEWETLRSGVAVQYKPAKRYDGKRDVETDDGLVLEKGTASIWVKLAQFFIENKIEPRAYIHAQFEEAGKRERPPNPDQLTSANSLFRWKRAKKRKEAEIKLALQIQATIATKKITILQAYGGKTPEDTSAITLLNIGLELSALFRYCLALSIGGKRFRRIARQFELEACLQFERFRKFYLRHWSKVLPEGFSERSRLIYDYLLWEPQNDDQEEDEEGW